MPGVLILLGTLIFSVSVSIRAELQVETTTFKGHATILFCESDLDNETATITWNKDNHTLEPSPHIIMQGFLLWILNTTLSDSGLYVCWSTNSTFSMESRQFLSVDVGPCPSPHVTDLALEGTNISLTCTKKQIPVPGQRLQVQWWKDCESTGIQGSEFSLFNVSMSDKSNYTCLVIFRYEDQNYTASRTFRLKVIKKVPMRKPRVIQPHNKTLYVKPDAELKLECTVFIGFGEESQLETSVYWIINDSFTGPELQQNLTSEKREDSGLYGNLTLFIPKVLPEFFGVPFKCIILNSNGGDIGQVWLSPDYDTKHMWLIITALLILAAVLGAVLLNFYKKDRILAFRQCCGKDSDEVEVNSATQWSVLEAAQISHDQRMCLCIKTCKNQ